MKKKIILLYTAMTSIILLSILIASGFMMSKTLKTNTAEYQSIIVTQAAQSITNRVKETWAVLDLIAKDDMISNVNSMKDEKLTVLKHMKESIGFDSVGFTDLSGKLLLYDGKEVNVNKREYFQEAMMGNSYVSSPIISIATTESVIIYSVPVKKNGKVVGVVIASVHAKQLTSLVNNIQMGETGYAYILDKEGNYISHPDESLITNQVNAIETADNDNYITMLKDSIEGNIGNGSYSFNNEDRFMSYTPISGTSFSMVITIDQDEIFQDLNKLIKLLIFFIIGGCIVTIAIAFMIYRRF